MDVQKKPRKKTTETPKKSLRTPPRRGVRKNGGPRGHGGQRRGSFRSNRKNGSGSLPSEPDQPRADQNRSPRSETDSSGAEQSAARSRAWCFTINNPVDVDVEQYQLEQPSSAVVFGTQDLVDLTRVCEFLIVSLECGRGSTPHFQGYLYLKGRGKTLSALHAISPRAHFEKALGTPAQNVEYCSKSDTHVAGPWTLGECPRQGRRSDLEDAISMVSGGASMRQIARDAPLVVVRYPRGIALLQQLYAAERARPRPFVFYIWGPTGTGKSTECRSSFPDVFYKPVKGSKAANDWWDGYDSHATIVWDEFYGSVPWSLMLRIADETTLALEVKGGFTYCQAQYVIFLSNIPPEECFPNLFREDPRKFSALVRRLVCFHKPAFNKIEFYDLRMKFGEQVVKHFDATHGNGGGTLDLFQYNIFNDEELSKLYDGRWTTRNLPSKFRKVFKD